MTDDPASSAPPRLRFHYIKSNFFRVVHVDGAIGGLTGPGYIHFAVYSERPALPLVTEHELSDKSLSGGVPVEGRTGFVRELEVDLIMSRDKAAELRDWLTRQIDYFDTLQKQATQATATSILPETR